MTINDNTGIGRRLLEEIQRKYGTQKALALHLGYKDGTIFTRYVKGASIPRNIMQQKLREAGLDIDYIMYGKDQASEGEAYNMVACKARMKELQAKMLEVTAEMAEISAMMERMEERCDTSDKHQ